ncbi:protein of unknown function [Bradyrhizobium sp. ORS 285]|uniref:hypothetical protein n=1 Tax=Bradyrhizobium sp. ORS 285 TaxID=115808 RepID=UPI000240B153|nr:hypothetical protein [Bradyrhizobium sp. ORS 285]CCD84771.1 hypothetical protein BRAO285_1260001 [Bradyrhizobium sp. ORS 285]SMX56400.1 protein of unknown function [Bradyrhizobium sp. ORS 285]
MSATSKYADEHIAAALANHRNAFSDFMHEVLADHRGDMMFHFYIDNLLVVIYEHHLRGKHINKTQAYRLIPIGHTNTCKKYVEEAAKRGFIRFVPDEKDSRRLNVVPTDDLISYVRAKVERQIDEARELIGRVAEAKPLPRDNLALAAYPK